MTRRTSAARARRKAEFRHRLASARSNLTRTLATLDEELDTLPARESPELAENAATGMVSEILTRLEGQERHELDEIAAAQARLEAGLFGVCEGCHRAIPLARLRATPTARHCATCQARLEARD